MVLVLVFNYILFSLGFKIILMQNDLLQMYFVKRRLQRSEFIEIVQRMQKIPQLHTNFN